MALTIKAVNERNLTMPYLAIAATDKNDPPRVLYLVLRYLREEKKLSAVHLTTGELVLCPAEDFVVYPGSVTLTNRIKDAPED